ncbi:hypothetical protein T492DRAFT_206012 [Pavlovales sp. CCMP2436]|nr:hypothetical protein T492DRAFT_206012 [Pavlovales sp. CCMP2436]
MAAAAATYLSVASLRRARGEEACGSLGRPPRLLRGRVGDVFVALRPALYDLNQSEGVKGFVLFVLYFCLYFVLQAMRIDAAWGRSTLQWFDEASHGLSLDGPLVSALNEPSCAGHWRGASDAGELCFWPFTLLTQVEQVVDFVGAGIPQLVSSVSRVCPRCDIAITPSAADLRLLNLTSFVCTSFDSSAGTDSYPSRDCAAENKIWASKPSIESAPCCDDARLVRLSLELMGIASLPDAHFADSASLSAAKGRPSEELARAGARAFVSDAIDRKYVVQMVISRAERMVGAEFHAEWVSREWAPGVVKTRLAFWTYRFDNTATQQTLVRLTALAGVICVAHELVRLWTHCPSKQAVAWRLATPYMLLVTIPSFVLPAVAELYQRPMSFSSWLLWVSANELLMFVRCFHEGHVLPPFKVIVLALSNATGQLASFGVGMLAAIAVLAAVCTQLFGAWHPGYASFGGAFTRVFTSFTVGAEIDEVAMAVDPAGAILVHYVTNLFLTLIVSQFFIAIVVGSFDATREVELELRRYREVPSGYAKCAKVCVGPASVGGNVWEVGPHLWAGHLLE